MDQLSELDDAQVAELQATILGEFEAVEKQDISPQTVDAMVSLSEMLDGVRAESKRREAAVVELSQRAAEASMRVHGEETDSTDPMAEETPAEEGTETPAVEAAEPATEEVVPTEEIPAPEVAPVPTDIPLATDVAPATEVPAEEAPAEDILDAPVVEEEIPAELTEEEKKKLEEAGQASTEVEPITEFSTEVTDTAVEVVEEAIVAETAEASITEDIVDAPEGSEASIQTPVVTDVPEAQENKEAPVTAAADNADNLEVEVPVEHRPVIKESAAVVAITAGADIPGYTAGSSMSSRSEVSTAMSARLHALRRVNGGDGEQHTVASFTTTYPESRVLGSDPEANWAKIQAVTGPEALVASGGHATPLETSYDIFGFGTDARPVRDSLPRFQAERGGLRFVTPPVLADFTDAVGVWTNTVDTTPGTAIKASYTVEAAAELTESTDAVTLQLQFGNLMSRAYPELITRHNELGLIRHAQVAEQTTLAAMATASTAVTSTSLIGFGRDFLVQLGRAATAYRSRHRLDPDTKLRGIIPSWVKDAMAADLALQMPGDAMLNAYAEIDGYVNARGVILTTSIDLNVFGAQSAGALLEFPDTFAWYLFSEGSFLFLDGGTLDLGIIRDSTLVNTNDYKMFVETFEGLAFVGIESLVVTSTINVNGVAAALRDTTGGATAAVIEY